VKLHILPRVVTTWKEFVETHPIRSIALDGYVKGEPRFNREGTHVNFNHHEDVNRLATRCTASQVSMAIMGGLLRYSPPKIPLRGSITATETYAWLFGSCVIQNASCARTVNLLSRASFSTPI